MGERNYVVYEPTPLGTGIIIAVFVSEIAANLFISNIAGEYAIAEVEVNDDTSIHRYTGMLKENADE